MLLFSCRETIHHLLNQGEPFFLKETDLDKLRDYDKFIVDEPSDVGLPFELVSQGVLFDILQSCVCVCVCVCFVVKCRNKGAVLCCLLVMMIIIPMYPVFHASFQPDS